VAAFLALALSVVNEIKVAINNKASAKYKNLFIFDTFFCLIIIIALALYHIFHFLVKAK